MATPTIIDVWLVFKSAVSDAISEMFQDMAVLKTIKIRYTYAVLNFI